MYARKDIPTVLPDAVLRCRKLQTAANTALDEMEKAKCRRINNLEWQQHTFQKTVSERHKRWRMNDRAFRIKLKRELGPDLAAALRRRTILEENQKILLEEKLIEESIKKQEYKESSDSSDASDDDEQSDDTPQAVIERVTKATSAQPKSEQPKITVKKPPQSAVVTRPMTSVAAKLNQTLAASNAAAKLAAKRPRTSRFHQENRRDTDPDIDPKADFGSVLLRILSDIAATPDLDDDFVIRKRALEARERRLIRRKDDRYYNLIDQLAPPKEADEEDDDPLNSLYTA